MRLLWWDVDWADGELTGILADVIPFADPDPEVLAVHAVQLEWDGQMLHAHATDRIRAGISSWEPDDQPEHDTQESLFTDWGSGDDRWTALIDLDDAKHLVKVFKLGPKEGRTPLTVEYDRRRLKVARSRDTGYSALTAVVETVHEEVFPDLRELLNASLSPDGPLSVAFTAKFLADFAKVRPRGPLQLQFNGTDKIVHVRIGERFIGAIMPVRLAEEH